MSEFSSHSLPWREFPALLSRLGFYFLVATAILSYPLITIGEDAITLFDVTLAVYLIVRLWCGGLSASRSWNAYWGVWALYIAYLILTYLFNPRVFGALLIAKHIEHVMFALVLVDHFERNRGRREQDFVFLLVIITAAIFYQLLYYHRFVWGIGAQYRLGIPFAQGVSSNPGGFFLASWIVLLFHIPWFWKRRVALSLVSLALASYTLLLTNSRTNILAVLLVLAVSVFTHLVKAKRAWIWLLILFLVFAAGYALFLQLPAPTRSIVRIQAIMRDPLSVLSDGSFSTRIYQTWPNAIGKWLESPKNIFFGAGLSSSRIVDGTVPRLLANQGFIGLVLFLYVWFVHFVFHRSSKVVVVLLLLSLINGLNGETLVISYRAIQIFLLILICAAVYGDSARQKDLHIGAQPNADS